MSKAGYPRHDAMREKAEKAFGSAELRGYDKPAKPSDCYKTGGRMYHGRVKKDIGGEIQKAGIMGLPSYLIDGVSNAFKHGGKVHHKPVRKNMGGMMEIPKNTADSIQQANQLLSNAAANGTGLKRGGHAHKHHSRHKRADGGVMNAIGDRDFNAGRKALGFNEGGKMADGGKMRKGGKMCGYETGGEIKKAMGGVGKIRHGQMTKKGAQIAPRARFKG